MDADDAFELVPEDRAELDRRIVHLEANPDDVVDWDTIMSQLRKWR